MILKKYTGKTSREALRKLREDLGEDAMVISTKELADGVEIIAMKEADAVDVMAQGGHEPRPAHSAANPPQRAAATSPAPANVMVDGLRPKVISDPLVQASHQDEGEANLQASLAAFAAQMAEKQRSSFDKTQTVAHEGLVNLAAKAPAASFQSAPRVMKPTAAASQLTIATAPGMNEAALMNEIKAMRNLMESQFGLMALREDMNRNPLKAQLWKDLVNAGFSPDFARTALKSLPADYNATEARRWIAEVIAINLPMARTSTTEPDLVDIGGTYALVGPTGVGKTTTTAKLAARCVVKHGAQSLGLITTDSYRVGAQDQLRIYGKLLGVHVFTAQTPNDLLSMLALMANKHMVLIDTVGMGQRDGRLAEQIAFLGQHNVKRLLLLNSSAHPETLDDVVSAYKGAGAHAANLVGTILSKLDESVKLGGVLDVVMRNKLQLHYVTNGQRVPEDLHPANALALTEKALACAKAHRSSAFSLADSEYDLTFSNLA
ncbi:flagellar biosynthesis protein FlhF [Ampullimonas aquatilis]|uniref:flagellar biosynthesis protein FlhF n=2 Tax=Bacteria TaxID=2 RepID=UPI003C7342BA